MWFRCVSLEMNLPVQIGYNQQPAIISNNLGSTEVEHIGMCALSANGEPLI